MYIPKTIVEVDEKLILPMDEFIQWLINVRILKSEQTCICGCRMTRQQYDCQMDRHGYAVIAAAENSKRLEMKHHLKVYIMISKNA